MVPGLVVIQLLGYGLFFFSKKKTILVWRLGSVLVNAEVPRVSRMVPWHSQTHNSDVFMLWYLPQFEIGFENGLF